MSSSSSALPDDDVSDILGKEPPNIFVADVPLTEKETQFLKDFRIAVTPLCSDVPELDKEYWTSDHLLRRIAVARSWDMKGSTTMFQTICTFRKEKQCWKYLNEPGFYKEPEVLRRYFPWGFVGMDREGFPVLVERTGSIDLVGMHAGVGTDDFLNWVGWYHEIQERFMRRCSSMIQKDRHKMTCIIDLNGIGLRHLNKDTLSVLHKRTRLEEEHYPEVVKRIFLINTPSIFASVWNVVRRFMDEGTASKVQILGSDYLPTLLKFVDADNIPADLGGNLRDEENDPYCKAMICTGGLVPLGFTTGVGADGKGAGEELVIPAGKTSDVILHIPSNATLRWKFGLNDKDIGFHITAWLANNEPVVEVTNNNNTSTGTKLGQCIPVTQSVDGVHILTESYISCTDTNKNPFKVPSTSVVGNTNDPLSPPSDVSTVQSSSSSSSSKTNTIEIVSNNRVNGTSSPITGSWTVPQDQQKAVIVRLRWDNSYSWMSSKTIARRIDIEVPNTEIRRAYDKDDLLAEARSKHREGIAEWSSKRIQK